MGLRFSVRARVHFVPDHLIPHTSRAVLCEIFKDLVTKKLLHGETEGSLQCLSPSKSDAAEAPSLLNTDTNVV